MFGLGTLLNTGGILAGGLFGLLFGKLFKERHQQTMTRVCGVSVLFIGISGALEQMMQVEGAALVGGKSMLIVISLALGGLLGEILNIEGWFERFGNWLKIKTGNAKDKDFVSGFVTASLTVCIGAMAIVGAIQDGIEADPSTLITKAILDFVIILVMTCSMGKGCMFSAIPVFVLQGTVTVLARLVKPLMTEAALGNLSLVGSVLIFCVGVNLVFDKRIRVANLLPAILFAVAAAFIPLPI